MVSPNAYISQTSFERYFSKLSENHNIGSEFKLWQLKESLIIKRTYQHTITGGEDTIHCIHYSGHYVSLLYCTHVSEDHLHVLSVRGVAETADVNGSPDVSRVDEGNVVVKIRGDWTDKKYCNCLK